MADRITVDHQPKTKLKTNQLYREDLATIHADGYGFHWQNAADALIDLLRACGIEQGKVIDLGCGGGQWLARLRAEGYQTCGIDVSASMIRLSKRVVPESDFICGSFADVKLPQCDAATSLGEPMNYLNSGAEMRRTLKNVYCALRPGGVFIFDVRHPATGPVPIINHNMVNEDWFCHARIEEDFRTNSLTRYITTFRRVGSSNRFRRDEEVHRLRIFSRTDVSGWLRKIGFRVQTKRGYGDYELTRRQSVFICRKPR